MLRPLLVLACLTATVQSSTAALLELYSTDFNSFPLGPDTVVGTDGWTGNNTGRGVHGTDELVVALGRSVYLGGVRPTSSPVVISKSIAYDPVAAGTPVIEIETILGIQDSTNNRRDSFFISIYNTTGNFLGAISFDNAEATFGIYRHNGTTTTSTGDSFLRNEIMFLTLTIDFAANTWSANLNDIPVFQDATFNATGQTRNLGFFAAEWWLAAPSVFGFGDNYMLIDELDIAAVTEDPVVPLEPFTIGSVTNTPGNTTLSWFGQAGITYQVEFSDDLLTWSSTLPDSSKTPGAEDTTLTYTDTSAPAGTRFYRVVRTLSN